MFFLKGVQNLVGYVFFSPDKVCERYVLRRKLVMYFVRKCMFQTLHHLIVFKTFGI